MAADERRNAGHAGLLGIHMMINYRRVHAQPVRTFGFRWPTVAEETACLGPAGSSNSRTAPALSTIIASRGVRIAQTRFDQRHTAHARILSRSAVSEDSEGSPRSNTNSDIYLTTWDDRDRNNSRSPLEALHCRVC
ncbi:hypothetical protein [Caballeronia arvi]|uniref:hypothetical protein n=1 Tax=Caballeronia arvi TaxID=1777135 RepID=UPI00190EE35B|nr:hypothetical protein [Caballeronia arvi]